MLDLPLRQTLLARSDLFRGMPEHLLRYVATHMVERTLDDRELLYFKDDTLEFIALVVEGSHPGNAFAALDDAVTTLIAAMHQWRPQGHLPATARLELQNVADMELLVADVYGYKLTFVLGTVRHGFDPAAADPFAAPAPPTPAPTPTPTPTP